jgi:hypothetical protein
MFIFHVTIGTNDAYGGEWREMADLAANQQKFLTALIAAPSLGVAAGRVGLSERTASRYLADPDFQDAYRAAQREALAVAMGKLSSLTGAAVATLQALLTDDTVPPAVRLAAAKAILDTAVKWVDTADLQERLAALEARAVNGAA